VLGGDKFVRPFNLYVYSVEIVTLGRFFIGCSGGLVVFQSFILS